MAQITETGTKAVTVEVTAWVTRLVGGDGTGRRLFDEPLRDGDTVADVLRRFSARFPELDAALWLSGRRELGEHLEVLIDDAALGVSHDLDSLLKGGEQITILGQFMGGSAQLMEPGSR